MKSAIFFDLDGTLIDSRADLATAVNLVRKNYSLPEYSMDTIVKFVGDGIKNLALRSFSELPDSEQDSALALLHRFYAAHEVDETRLYPGVTEGLAALRQAGFLLFIATNKPVGNAKKICSIPSN